MNDDRASIFGVDFSGASEPADAIWITEAMPRDQNLEVTACCAASEWFDFSSGTPRQRVLENIREWVTTNQDALFGFDFPFGLPKPVAGDRSSWRAHIAGFDDRYETQSAAAFRDSCVGYARENDSSGRSQLLRETDWRYGAQCPYSVQIRYQTLYGQYRLLEPLVTGESACVLPMQERRSDKPWLVEVYPAATLGRLGLYRTGYKDTPGAEKRRSANLDGLEASGVDLSRTDRTRPLESDDALDSIVAAVAANRALEQDFEQHEDADCCEGEIFA